MTVGNEGDGEGGCRGKASLRACGPRRHAGEARCTGEDVADAKSVVEGAALGIELNRMVEVRLARLTAVGGRIGLEGLPYPAQKVLVQRACKAHARRRAAGAANSARIAELDRHCCSGYQVVALRLLRPLEVAAQLTLLAASPAIPARVGAITEAGLGARGRVDAMVILLDIASTRLAPARSGCCSLMPA